MSDLVHLTINGHKVSVQKGTLLVEAARQASVEIPVFCYHPKLKPVGACRMCLVEIDKIPRLQTACTTPVAEGMVCNSAAPNAIAGQNAVIEMLLANHPLDCPICDKGGECPLQDNTFRFGLGTSRMQEAKRHKDKAFELSSKIVLDKERCIMCYRCTRFQTEIAGDSALVALERGEDSEIGTADGEAFDSPFSGNTIELCPVGALTSRFYRFRARPWDISKTPSVCAGCSVGCNVALHARDGAILRVLSRDNPAIDDGWLCDKGRFETLPPLTHPAHVSGSTASKRPMEPMLRRDGALVPATWNDAIARAVELLRGESLGGKSLGGRAAILAAPTLTNEAVVALDRHLRPLLPQSTIACAGDVHTPWLLQGKISELARCTKIVNVGLDPWSELPVLALWQRKALERGGVIVAVSERNGLWRDTAAWLRADAKQLAATLRELLQALAGGSASESTSAPVAAAARKLQHDGPGALLLGVAAARDASVLELARQLATRLGSNGTGGVCGAPALAPNARGIQEQAPGLAKQSALGAIDALLTLGPVETTSPGRRIVATWTSVPDTPDIEVVLPLAHPYEQTGTWTNLDGHVQKLGRSGFSVRQALPDHVLLAHLCRALGGEPPIDASAVRSPLDAHRGSLVRPPMTPA